MGCGSSGSIKEDCDAFIQSSKVAVIAKSFCPFCKEAIALLKSKINDENDMKIYRNIRRTFVLIYIYACLYIYIL